MSEHVRLLIIGSGPAGYTAAIYGARANLSPVLYAGLTLGGQLTQTTEIENFPGYPQGTTGQSLMDDLRAQAERLGADLRNGVVVKADLTDTRRVVTLDDGKEIEADAVIIATGAEAKYLGLPSEQKFRQLGGVSACATCDGFFYRNRVVAVVGGGDTAGEEATYLASICEKVYLIVRKPAMRASKAMVDRVNSTPNLEVLYNTVTDEVLGDDNGVTGVRVLNTETNEKREIPIHGFFLAIGHKPNSDVFKHQINVDEQGYIKTEPGTPKTNVAGVFAAGDVQDPHYRQAITAAASGCKAALDAERFLGTRKF
ncbi:MAG: thioredoxin-disulfide reductase [Bacteroides sp.]